MAARTDAERLFGELTRQAYKAASEGDWSAVIQLYDQREQVILPDAISSDVARQFMKYDQWMVKRIQDVQASTQQQIHDVQDQRRKLASLKRQWVSHAPVHPRYHVTV